MKQLTFALPSLSHGGAEKVFLELAEYFISSGHRVTLIVLDFEGELLDRLPSGLDVVDLSNTGPMLVRRLKQLWAFRCVLKRRKTEILLSTITGMNLFALVALAFLPSVKIVIREANSLENIVSISTLWMIRLLYRRADSVICTSQYVRQQLMREGVCQDRQLKFLPNPFFIDRIRQQSQILVRDVPVFQGKRIVAVGRLVPQKGFDVLIQALGLSCYKDSLQLIIVGEGPQRNQLERQVAAAGLKNVHLLGYRENPYPYVARADIVAIPSRWEGYVNTAVEAMVLSKQLVITDCHSGPGELLRAMGQSLVPIGDAIALSGAIDSAFEDGKARDYGELIGMHDFPIVAQQYLQVLDA